jgi:hypothetical protein
MALVMVMVIMSFSVKIEKVEAFAIPVSALSVIASLLIAGGVYFDTQQDMYNAINAMDILDHVRIEVKEVIDEVNFKIDFWLELNNSSPFHARELELRQYNRELRARMSVNEMGNIWREWMLPKMEGLAELWDANIIPGTFDIDRGEISTQGGVVNYFENAPVINAPFTNTSRTINTRNMDEIEQQIVNVVRSGNVTGINAGEIIRQITYNAYGTIYRGTSSESMNYLPYSVEGWKNFSYHNAFEIGNVSSLHQRHI